MYQLKVEVESNEKVSQNIYKIRFHSPQIASLANPGQFVHLLINEDRSYILRRPFSIHRVIKDSFEILFQVVGKGTKHLSKVVKGSVFDVIGPIGHGFEVKDEFKNILVVAGGIGIAPLMFLSESLKAKDKEVCVLFGAPMMERLVCLSDLEECANKAYCVTDDGSFGFKGVATDYLNEVLTAGKPDLIAACGPEEMLKIIVKFAKERQIPCQVSLERRMGCGIGACFSCVCETIDGYKRVCVDGPVFDVNELVW